MTRAQIKAKIRYNLNDAGITYYSDVDLNDSIQDGYDEIVCVSECIEKFIDISADVLLDQTIGNGRPWVKVNELIPDYYRIIGILNRSTRMFIDANISRNEDHFRFDWQIHNNSNIYSYVINGPQWLAFPNNNFNANSGIMFRIFYKAIAPIVQSDTEHFKILNDYSRLIELYSTADLLEQNQEYTKATNQWVNYELLLTKYSYKIQLLSKADRTFTREA